jgi:phenylacetate-coenzyme A ligase PaaK-like adenylate-forming protein
VILSYPAVYQHLAYLKRKGLGVNIKPTVMYTAGALLDNYTKSYVEDAFKCPLLNSYQSVEAQGTIASQCKYGKWHIYTDFYHLEAIDEKENIVPKGKRGHLVITRLYGKGTPIIRYTGMDDWVRLSDNKKCECGLFTPIIVNGVEGRMRANIVLPDGKVFPPGAFCFIEPVLQKNKTFKIKQYQIVQKKIDQIDILIVVDEELRNIGTPIETLIKEIKENYRNKVGKDVELNVFEVESIKHPNDANKPPPIVVSHVSIQDGYKRLEE